MNELKKAEDAVNRKFVIACAKRQLKTVRHMVECGMDVNMKLEDGSTGLLFAASMKSNSDVVRYLIKKGAMVDAADDSGHTPLYTAVCVKNWDVACMLLKNGANPDLATKDGVTPLMVAALRNRIECDVMLV